MDARRTSPGARETPDMTSRHAARLAAALALALAAAPAPAEEEPFHWTEGPAEVDVGRNVAGLNLPDGLIFAGEKDTKRLLERVGNVVDGSEVGLVTSKAEGENWFIVFEWDDVGYVKDDEKDEIDADALLESIREATEASNEERVKLGGGALHVVGWSEPPHYDDRSHNLTWAVVARDDAGDQVVNYNVRVLGRSGVMSVTLVDDPANLQAAKPQVDRVISALTYKPGKTYAEWVPGDKVAAYGLTALVAAGAGAAAVKTGLLAVLLKFLGKAWKLVAVGVAAVGAGAVKIWNALRGRASATAGRTDQGM
jgi:uncharacterized membrane-anchored protein